MDRQGQEWSRYLGRVHLAPLKADEAVKLFTRHA
jgi:hypothetical protein